MDAYEVLGVTPTTPLPEIEAAYRLLIREHHPDLHQAEGPDAVAQAERTTRRLNAAMSRIRADYRNGGPGPRGFERRPGWGGPDTADGAASRGGTGFGAGFADPGRAAGGAGPSGGFADTSTSGFGFGPPDPDHDWFGNRIRRPTDPVPCPYCGQVFTDLGGFRLHLSRRHPFAEPAMRPKRAHRHSFSPIRILGYARFLPAWLLALIAPFAFFGGAPMWLYLGDMILLVLVLWAQTSPRFKPQALHDR